MTATEAETEATPPPTSEPRLPERFSIADLIQASGSSVTDRQVRHWVEQGWCVDVTHDRVGGRVGQRWQFGSSGFAHAREMAWLHTELGIHPPLASEIASSLLMTGQYVSEHFTLCATRAIRTDPDDRPELPPHRPGVTWADS